jgi:hypothetical protein
LFEDWRLEALPVVVGTDVPSRQSPSSSG